MADVSDPAIVEAYQTVRKEGEPTNWLLLGYENNKKIVLKGSGSGGIEELASNIQDNDCYYGYLKLVNKDDETTRTKFAFLTFKGESAPVMRKGNMSVHVANVKQVIKDYAIEFHTSEKEELTEEQIITKLKKANY